MFNNCIRRVFKSCFLPQLTFVKIHERAWWVTKLALKRCKFNQAESTYCRMQLQMLKGYLHANRVCAQCEECRSKRQCLQRKSSELDVRLAARTGNCLTEHSYKCCVLLCNYSFLCGVSGRRRILSSENGYLLSALRWYCTFPCSLHCTEE